MADESNEISNEQVQELMELELKPRGHPYDRLNLDFFWKEIYPEGHSITIRYDPKTGELKQEAEAQLSLMSRDNSPYDVAHVAKVDGICIQGIPRKLFDEYLDDIIPRLLKSGEVILCQHYFMAGEERIIGHEDNILYVRRPDLVTNVNAIGEYCKAHRIKIH